MPKLSVLVLLAALPSVVQAQSVALEPTRLVTHGVRVEAVTYKGRPAVKATEETTLPTGPGRGLIVVPVPAMIDGTIEVDVAGLPGAGAAQTARGFIGVAFRVAEDAGSYESIYLRPTNARADDQVRRNHTVQYVSAPDFPWERLRKEFPERYETHVDMEVGEWTAVRIVVNGARARLYVNGQAQPTLIVNDLKLAPRAGSLALWIGPGTDGYFTNLRVRPGPSAP